MLCWLFVLSCFPRWTPLSGLPAHPLVISPKKQAECLKLRKHPGETKALRRLFSSSTNNFFFNCYCGSTMRKRDSLDLSSFRTTAGTKGRVGNLCRCQPLRGASPCTVSALPFLRGLFFRPAPAFTAFSSPFLFSRTNLGHWKCSLRGFSQT